MHDATCRQAVVRDAPRGHPRAGGPRSSVDGKLAAPAHPRYDGVALGEVIANLVRLPGEQLPPPLQRGTHRRGIALAPGGIEQIRPLDDANLRSDELGQLILRRPATIKRAQEPLDDRDVLSRRRHARTL